MTSVNQNCEGVTIDYYSGQGTGSGGSTTTIARTSGHIIAVVSTTSTDYAANLPSDAVVGDVVEVFFTGGVSGHIYAPSGESFLYNGSTGFDASIGLTFRKINSSTWTMIPHS